MPVQPMFDQQSQFYQDSNIVQWREKVADTLRMRKPPDRLIDSSSGQKPYRPWSASRSNRTSLAQISGNARNYELRKRKRGMDAEDQTHGGIEGSDGHVGRGRGRPPKNPGQQLCGTTTQIPIRDASAKPSSASRSRGSSYGRSNSRKRTLDKEKSTASIDFKYLASCDPPVQRKSLEELVKEKRPPSKAAMDLYWRLKKIPNSIIPTDLMVNYLVIRFTISLPLTFLVG